MMLRYNAVARLERRERPVALMRRVGRPISVGYVAATEIQVLDMKSIGRIEFFLRRPPYWRKRISSERTRGRDATRRNAADKQYRRLVRSRSI